MRRPPKTTAVLFSGVAAAGSTLVERSDYVLDRLGGAGAWTGPATVPGVGGVRVVVARARGAFPGTHRIPVLPPVSRGAVLRDANDRKRRLARGSSRHKEADG